MHRSQFARIESHPLRRILLNVCNDPRDTPGKKQLRADLIEALHEAPAEVIDALVTKATEFARAAVDPGARFDLRGAATRLALHVVDTLEADDRLVPVEDIEPVDVSDVMDDMDSCDPTEKSGRALNQAAKASELEANRVRHLGGN
jgi:hypothetical protein